MTTMEESFFARAEREAAEKVAALLDLPIDEFAMGGEGTFDPWELFPCLYGSYSSDFDECAIAVLTELIDGNKQREDLGAEMFREMLCTAALCDYGSSPRVCFPTEDFRPLLPRLIEKWREFSALQWDADPPIGYS